MQPARWRLVLLFMLLLLLGGCYTVIQHRRVSEPVGYYSDCLQCHESGMEHYYVEEVFLLQADAYSRYGADTRYHYFHDSPWWWDYRYTEEEAAREDETASPLVRLLRRQRNRVQVAGLPEAASAVNASQEEDAESEDEEESSSHKKKLKRRRR